MNLMTMGTTTDMIMLTTIMLTTITGMSLTGTIMRTATAMAIITVMGTIITRRPTSAGVSWWPRG